MKKKVLVFPCGSEIGLEINKALAHSKHFELIGASSVSSNHGKHVFKNYTEGLPLINDENFITELSRLIDKYNIDYLYPAHDSVIIKLIQYKKDLKCEVLAPCYKTCSICREKSKTYDIFKGILKTPIIYNQHSSNIEWPVFLKPNIGQGSKGTCIAKNKYELDFYLRLNPSLIIMEYLPGKEYTIDCFTNKSGNLLFVGGRERRRIKDGISVNTYPFLDERFNKMAEKINSVLDIKGTWFFQVKERKDKDLVLMEIGPRIAGSMALYRNLGVNLPLLNLYDKEGLDVRIIMDQFHLEMDRALVNRFKHNINFKAVYVDLDDTIIVDGKVNSFLVAFIYQCINKNIKVNLITRHVGNIEEYLKKYRLYNLFDEIIQIPNGRQKQQYIKEVDSIFIDDSFAERSKISQTLKIPTFDLCSVESLLDWRV